MLGARSCERCDRRLHRLVGLVALVFVAGSTRAAANTVEAVSWDHDPSGNTIIAIDCAEPVDPSSIRSYPLADPARIVVVIGDVSHPVEPDILTIDDVNVKRLRLGFHDELTPAELHVILDLEKTDAVRMLELRKEGSRIFVVVGTRSGKTTTRTPFDSPPPIPSTPAATPSSTPSPSPTRRPPPTATPTPQPTRTPTPAFPDRPAPPVVPTAKPPNPAATTVTTTAGEASPIILPSPGPPTAISGRETATEVVDITASARGDGSTLLRITGNGRLPQGCARVLEVADESPRVIVTIQGMTAPDLPRSIDIDDANIDRIRLVHDAETARVELHLVLHLTRSGISVAEMNQVGPHLVVLLTPAESLNPAP